MSAVFSRHLFDPSNETVITNKLSKLLSLVRKHLSMDVAFVSEFINGKRVFRFVDNPSTTSAVQVGNSDPSKESYCRKIADNQLEQIIPDSKNHPITGKMPVTQRLNIGAYMGVPITLNSGEIYGTLCCYKSHKDESLNNRDLAFLKLISEIATELIEKKIQYEQLNQEAKAIIEQIISTKNIHTYFQPIFNLKTNKISGFESLARFFIEPYRAPDVWFNEAATFGLGESLEMSAIENTLAVSAEFDKDLYISINTSPEHILSGALEKALHNTDCRKIVLEITEHTQILDYQAIRDKLAPLRAEGMRLAIDDAGAGYASFQHILELQADIIKLDVSLTQNINCDKSKFLLAKALCGFSKAINCIILAEGIETLEELNALRTLGVDKVQGYFLGKPGPLSKALALQTSKIIESI